MPSLYCYTASGYHYFATGQIVRVRSRQYLVEEVVPKPSSTEDTLVCLSCLKDDAIGESLSVLWEREEDAQMEAATKEAAGDGQSARELEILESMADVANHARHQQDPRIKKLVEWIRTNLCPDLGKPNATWLERRVIIFTEYTNTKRYLQQQLQAAIASSNRFVIRTNLSGRHLAVYKSKRGRHRSFRCPPLLCLY